MASNKFKRWFTEGAKKSKQWFIHLPGKIKHWFVTLPEKVKHWFTEGAKKSKQWFIHLPGKIKHWFVTLPEKVKHWFAEFRIKMKRWFSENTQLLIPVIAILALLLFNLIRDPSFFSITKATNNDGYMVFTGNLITILNNASELAILAIGMTLVTAASGGQDISVGAAAAIGGSVFVKILKSAATINAGVFILAILASCLVAMIFGAFNGTLVSVFNIQPMIATLILYTCGRSIAYWINGGATPTIENAMVKAMGTNIPNVPLPTPIFIVIICICLFGLLFRFTTLSTLTQAVGINQKASRLNGINTVGIKLLSFIILGFCVGIAGCISVSRMGLINHETILLDIEMDAILAVAIGGNALSGGKFKISGSILGAYTIQALTITLYAMKVSSTAIKAYKALVIILLVVLASPVVKEFLGKLWNKITNNRTLKRREPLTDSQLLLTITICIFFVMYVAAMLIWGGAFLKPQNIFDMLNENASLIIIACGLTIIMISGGIDISVGAISALVVMCCAVYLDSPGGNLYVAILMAIGIGLLFGVVHGLLISYLKIQPFIITLAGMFFARGMITIVSSKPHNVANAAFKALKSSRILIPWLGHHAKNGNLIPAKMDIGVIVALVIVVLIFLMLRYTRFGRNLYAIGGNSQSALMLGVNVKLTRFFGYVISGLLAGIAGFVLLLRVGAGNATNAAGAEMNAIASSIIGGTLLTGGVGNVAGTFFGVLTLSTIKKIVVTSGLRDPWWQTITTGAMLCFFILLQSVVLSNRGKINFSKLFASKKKAAPEETVLEKE